MKQRIRNRREVIEHSFYLLNNRVESKDTKNILELCKPLSKYVSNIYSTNDYSKINRIIIKMLEYIKPYVLEIDKEIIYYHTDINLFDYEYGTSKKYLNEVKYRLFVSVATLVTSVLDNNYIKLSISEMLYNLGRLHLIINKK